MNYFLSNFELSLQMMPLRAVDGLGLVALFASYLRV